MFLSKSPEPPEIETKPFLAIIITLDRPYSQLTMLKA
jgi:hypothetical protein